MIRSCPDTNNIVNDMNSVEISDDLNQDLNEPGLLENSQLNNTLNQSDCISKDCMNSNVESALHKTNSLKGKSSENSTDFFTKYLDDQMQKTLDKKKRKQAEQQSQLISQIDKGNRIRNTSCGENLKTLQTKNKSTLNSKGKQTAREKKEMKRRSMAKLRQDKDYVEKMNASERKRMAEVRQDKDYVKKCKMHSSEFKKCVRVLSQINL